MSNINHIILWDHQEMLCFKIHSLPHSIVLIPSNAVGVFGSVNAVHKLCRRVVAQVLCNVGCGVNVAMASYSMVAEAVGVLHTQVQTLDTQRKQEKTLMEFCKYNKIHSKPIHKMYILHNCILHCSKSKMFRGG